MSGHRNRYPTDAQNFRQDYMNNLGLQSSIDDMNLKANQVYKASGQLPPQSSMPDNRTASEKLADTYKLKVSLVSELKTIGSANFAQAVVQGIENSPLNANGDLLIFFAQNSKELIKNLAKKYQYGIKGDANDANQFRLFVEQAYNQTKSLSSSVAGSFNRPSSNSGKFSKQDLDTIMHQFAELSSRITSKYGANPSIKSKIRSVSTIFGELKNFMVTQRELDGIKELILQRGMLEQDSGLNYEMGINILYNRLETVLDSLPNIETVASAYEQLRKALTNSNDALASDILIRIRNLFPDDGDISELRSDMEHYITEVRKNPNMNYELSGHTPGGPAGPSKFETITKPINPDRYEPIGSQNEPVNIGTSRKNEILLQIKLIEKEIDNKRVELSRIITKLRITHDAGEQVRYEQQMLVIENDLEMLDGQYWELWNELKDPANAELGTENENLPLDIQNGHQPFQPRPLPEEKPTEEGLSKEDLLRQYAINLDVKTKSHDDMLKIYDAVASDIEDDKRNGISISKSLKDLYESLQKYLFGWEPDAEEGGAEEPTSSSGAASAYQRPVPKKETDRTKWTRLEWENLIDPDASMDARDVLPQLRLEESKYPEGEAPKGLKEAVAHLRKIVYPEEGKAEGHGLKRGRGRPRGSGIAHPFKDKVDTSRGIEPERRFVKFGRYLINTHKLNDNVVAIKTPSGTNITKYPSQRVSPHLSTVFKKIIGGGVPSFNELSKLNDDEKNYLYNVSKKAEIADKLSIPTPSKDQKEQDIHEYEVMKGEILSGNDNKELIKKFKVHMSKLSRQGVLPKKEVNEILTDLLELGH